MFFISFCILFWSLAFYRVSWITMMSGLGLFLLAAPFVFPMSPVIFYGIYVLELTILTLFAIPFLRRKILSRPLQLWVRKTLPPISQTEQEAISAGDRWIEAEIFQAKWDLKDQLQRPRAYLTPEEQAFIDGPLAEFCSKLNDWKIVHEDWDLSPELWSFLKTHKFFGMVIHKQYGGLGFSAFAHSTIVAQIAAKSPSAAVITMVPNSLGPGELLMHYGTEEQKQYYLPRLALGEEIPCFALTGIDAGSDAGAMTDYGIVTKDQNGNLGMKLSWNKRYITLAPIATIMGLAFKLYDPEHLLSDQVDRGITLCLIPTNHPGVEIGSRHNPLGMAFPNGPTTGRDVFVPLSSVIGGPEKIGQGWKMLVECLSVGRGLSLPALGTAVGHLCSFHTAAYASIREQFRVQIGAFEGVSDAIGSIGGLTYLLESARVETVSGLDAGVKPAVISAVAKYHMTEMGRIIINKAMDVHGGKGIIMGPRNRLAHIYIAAPISITVEGANILTRSLMIFGQGAIRCHPYLLLEMNNASQDSNLREFDRALTGHLSYATSNVIRGITAGWTRGYIFHDQTHYPEKWALRGIQHLSLALSVASDFSFARYGGALKRYESLSARLGDILSYLYLAVSVVDRHARQPDLAQDRDFAVWSLKYCLHHAQEAFYEFTDNVTPRVLGCTLRWMFFPYGRVYSAPSDAQTHRLAEIMMNDHEALERLSFLASHPGQNDSTSLLKEAFMLKKKLAPSLKAFAKWQRAHAQNLYADSVDEQYRKACEDGVIDKNLYPEFIRYETLKREVIMTDSHDPSLHREEK